MLQLASGLDPGAGTVPRRRGDRAGRPDHAPFGPLWQQVPWEEALEKAGSGLPYIEGMLVIGVLLRPGETGERPTSLVAQQDPSGEIILSIEGPADKVSELREEPGRPRAARQRMDPDPAGLHHRCRAARCGGSTGS